MADILIIDAVTGETVERDYTPEEAKQRKIDEKAANERAMREAAKQARQSEARAAAVVHAKSLGFTDDMIAVMYPGLAPAE